MRNILYFIIFALVASSIAWGRDYGISYVDEPYQSQGPADSIAGVPPLPVGLKFITDSLVNDTVGRITAHQIGFQLPAYTFQPGGLLRGRQAVVTFPPEFRLTTIDSVSYRDTDNLPDPRITWVFVYSQSVVVRFSDEIPGPNGPYFVYITFHSITNATVADNYRIAVKVDNTYGQTVAGPTFSDQFVLVADAPHALELLPKEDTALAAGDGVLLEPRVLDQYGNRVNAGPVALSIDPNQDMIGRLQGYYFMATTVGVGRVLAGLGDLNAASGEITVTPGPAAVMTMALAPDTVMAGENLHNEVSVWLFDGYGNRVIGYDRPVWFSSDDPLSDIVHDQANPYQFTPADEGEKGFSGEEFIFHTAGQRTLTVTDGSLTAQVDEIFVRSANLAAFDVSLPPIIRAGDAFSIEISNASDSYGNPYFGTLTVHVNQIAPDGTLPFTEDIIVSAGTGAGSAMLPRTGLDTLSISGVSLIKLVMVDVLPGAAASFDIALDPTQFVGHPFRGTSSVTVYDRFRNLKTDFASLGITTTLTVDSGQIIPDTIGAGQFVNGSTSLAGYRYEGVPSSITLTITAEGPGGTIVANASFAANGLIINELALGQTPANIPQNWFFRLQGTARNPGNIAPIRVLYMAGFVEDQSLHTLNVSPPNCLPQPGDQTGCDFVSKPYLSAWPNPGVHDFVIESRSLYLVGDDSVEVTDRLTHQVEILPFTPLTAIASELPDTILQGDFETNGSITFENANMFSYPTDFVGYLSIEKDWVLHTVGTWQGPFTWPPQETFSLPVRFDNLLSTGTYRYQVRYSMSVQSIESGSLGYNSLPQYLTRNVVIAPRAVYEVSPESISPKRVTVGAQIPFAFDLLLDGVTSTILNGSQSVLTLTDGAISSSAPLTPASITLEPGPNRIGAQAMTIPASWVGKDITGHLRLIGVEAGRAAVDTEIVFPFPIIVEALPGIQVLSLDLDAPNPPYVNLGQRFTLTARIVNHSAMEISGPINVEITSDGRTIPTGNAIGAILENIPPGDTVVLNVPITADTLPNPAEVFTITIEPSGEFIVLPAVDNQAAIVIQPPVTVALTPGSVSIPNAVAYLDYGEPFEVVVRFEHADLSRVVGGSLALNYSGPGDFGVSFPIEKPLDTVMVWNLTAPDLDINSSFSITWQQIPLDRNNGQPITGLGGPITLSFAVRVSITKLVIDVRSLVTAPLQRGVTTPIFQMDVQNVTNDTRNQVHLQSMALTFTDRDGRQIDAAGMIADSGSAFYSDGTEITTLNFGGGKANFHFANLIISPGQKAELELRLTVKKEAALDYFSLQLTGNDFSAEIAEGPRVGQPVPVYGLLDKPFTISLPQAVIAENLGESFKNYPNPFNPEIEQTEIRYYLPAASDVDILIFTATGEKVREMRFNAGGDGGRAGVNGGVFWDGRNGEGDMVLNGVYVAVIKVAEGDLAAKVKIAVVK